MRHCCTYFDSRYLTRALALYGSLRRHAGSFVLHALCLDAGALKAVVDLNQPNLHPISLEELECAEPALLRVKSQRTVVEYYFTLTPVLTQYVMDNHAGRIGENEEGQKGPAGEPRVRSVPGFTTATQPIPARPRDQKQDIPGAGVTYLDADLYFFADPQPVFDALGDNSTLIIEHRYPPHLQEMRQYGRFNVGLLTFRADARGRACLGWWKQSCLEWCHERLEGDRYADQKYLDQFPRRFEGVSILPHKGVNLAPWNLGNYRLTRRQGRTWVDDDPLVMYHFHRLRVIRPGLFDPGFVRYGVAHNPIIARHIYGPYLRELRQLQQLLPSTPSDTLRLAPLTSNREVLRLMLYGRPLFNAGPLTAELNLEPWARPLLRLRERTLGLLGMKRAA